MSYETLQTNTEQGRINMKRPTARQAMKPDSNHKGKIQSICGEKFNDNAIPEFLKRYKQIEEEARKVVILCN